jgi:hypothetical protein
VSPRDVDFVRSASQLRNIVDFAGAESRNTAARDQPTIHKLPTNARWPATIILQSPLYSD